DRVRRQLGRTQGAFHRLLRPDARRMRLSEMMVVGRNAVAANFRQDLRATRFGLLQIFEREHGSTFAEHEAAASGIKWPAFFRSCGLERIETDEHEFGKSVVTAGEDALVTT